MSPKLRLYLCAIIVALSGAYAVLIATDIELAKAVALGYIGLILTIFLLLNVWRRP
jgi:hypothetical protein